MENPTPTVDPAAPLEPPRGTLEMAMAQIDEALNPSPKAREIMSAMPGLLEAGELLRAAWATVRAAAIKSLEPPPAPVAKPKGTPAERARTFVATTLDAMHRIAEDPSPDAAAAVQVQAAFAQVVLGGLMIETLATIAARVEDIGDALEGGDYPSIARSLSHIANGVSR